MVIARPAEFRASQIPQTVEGVVENYRRVIFGCGRPAGRAQETLGLPVSA